MKITALQVYPTDVGNCNRVFTEMFTDEGIVGISEVTIRRKGMTVAASIRELERFLVGKDPTCIEDHWEKMYRDSFWVGGPLHSTALSAVETCMWDIMGKWLGVPVYKLFGGPTRDRVRIYGGAGGPTPERAAESIRGAVAAGFGAVKTGLVQAGAEWHPSAKETEHVPGEIFTRTAECIAAMREAAGPNVDIAIDLHGRFSPANAIRLARMLEPYNLLFMEEPIPSDNIDALLQVSRGTSIPIATGERIATKYGFRPLIEQRVVEIIQPDVCNVGGLMEAKKVAAMAEANYISVAPHNPNGPVADAMSVHVAASIPNFLILEGGGAHRPSPFVKNPLKFEDGCLLLPTGPGLGIELDREALLASPYIIDDATR
jgi:galactonate dehydratase